MRNERIFEKLVTGRRRPEGDDFIPVTGHFEPGGESKSFSAGAGALLAGTLFTRGAGANGANNTAGSISTTTTSIVSEAGRRASRKGGFGRGVSLLAIVVLAAAFCSSCNKKVEELDKWPFEARGIKLNYRADDNLNIHDDEAHTLFVCVYQLIDPNAYNDLKMDRQGVVSLLDCKRFDESVASTESFIVHPGDEETLVFDRAEDARFFGVVAGYYNLYPRHATRLILVPVKIEKSGFFIRKRTAVPGKLTVNLYFGPEEIQQILETEN